MGTTNMTFGNGAYLISKGNTNIAEGAGAGQATGDVATLSADSVASASDTDTGGTLSISTFASKVLLMRHFALQMPLLLAPTPHRSIHKANSIQNSRGQA